MKILYSAVVCLMILPMQADADTYVKHEIHTDGYYYGGRITEPVDRVVDVWIGAGRASYDYLHRRIILDLERGMLTFVNKDDSTYAETALPLDWSALVTEEALAQVEAYKTVGTIGESSGEKEIGGMKCRCYELNTWIPYEDIKYRETEDAACFSDDVPIDLDMFGRIHEQLLRLRNYSDEFAESMMRIRGYMIASERIMYIKGFGVKTTETIVEMEERDPPAGIYSAPDGFIEKERLTLGDLRGG